MYIKSTEANFPRESIRQNGALVLDYLGGFNVFDQLGLNQKISVKLGSTGIYFGYPISAGRFGKSQDTTVFIPVPSIQYINALHQPQMIQQQQNKSVAKRAMVGSMIGGRRGARLGALSAMGTKTTTVQSSAYHFIVKFEHEGSMIEFSMFTETTNPNEIRTLDSFHDIGLMGLLGSKLVRDGDFSQLSQPTTQATVQDPYEEITKLKGLLDQGIITQEEFDLKKKQLLGL